MDLDRSDLTVFVYNWGVVLSGGYIALTYDMTTTDLGLFSLVLGVLWTIYYRLVMEDKLPPFDEQTQEIDERELPNREDEPIDHDEPPEQGGPDAPWE
ncbi:hypothetical protein Huta_1423 [Halorhabdus utahensis DSM 12940]|uniref:DUF8074 domain-containing protein n=1 Tax=Halorhabdus utahensis (strain DSM 12940 / JCM 11049 / AX-2) TaxID=519442 RepID=C7NNS4_HALUD|nr:hypothetical protein [Halorhabdus utahensis]ACV11599.1 hypothetical protein Huta_1423 [Halorhabdus utahensis DSM 12940]